MTEQQQEKRMYHRRTESERARDAADAATAKAERLEERVHTLTVRLDAMQEEVQVFRERAKKARMEADYYSQHPALQGE